MTSQTHPAHSSYVLPPLRVTNPADFGRVGVLMGGWSMEREISLSSGEQVILALQSKGVHVEPVDVGRDIFAVLQERQFDRVFNALHGGIGENGCLQGALDILEIPYTSCGVLPSALSMDKFYCKQLWAHMGLSTPPHTMVTEQSDPKTVAATVGLPMAIKPVGGGSSVGITKLSDLKQFSVAVKHAAQYDPRVFAESWVDGTFYTVGILPGVPLPSARVETPRDFYDYAAKYQVDTTQYFCPSGLAPEQEAEIRKQAYEAFEAIAGYGLARVDFIRDHQGRNWVLDLNTIPGLSPRSLIPKMAQAVGLSYPDLIWRILETAV